MGERIDRVLEERALRQHGLLGRGVFMGNALYAMEYSLLPQEAKKTLDLIIKGGPFPYPAHDGKSFGNNFGDLPSKGEYFEFTVPTPGVFTRGMRRLVVRRNGMVFFTACHYERVGGNLSKEQRKEQTLNVAEDWRNGFYVVTGMDTTMRNAIQESIKLLRG